MKRRPKPLVPEANPSELAADADAILQVKVWLVGISPMVWRRVLVPTTFTLRELHGVIQVAMGWEGIHVWTAPWVQGRKRENSDGWVDCDHVSGLLTRRHDRWPRWGPRSSRKQ